MTAGDTAGDLSGPPLPPVQQPAPPPGISREPQRTSVGHPPVVLAQVQAGVAELGGESSPLDIVGLVVVEGTRLAVLTPPPQSPVLRGSVSSISLSRQHSLLSVSAVTYLIQQPRPS